MPQKLQPRGIELDGLGHPGTGLFHNHQAHQPVQQAKKQAEAGKSRLDKRSLPGSRDTQVFGWPRKRDWMKQARSPTMPALDWRERPRLTAVVLHYRQCVVVVARSGQGLWCVMTQQGDELMRCMQTKRGEAKRWPPARNEPIQPRLVRCRLGSINQCG